MCRHENRTLVRVSFCNTSVRHVGKPLRREACSDSRLRLVLKLLPVLLMFRSNAIRKDEIAGCEACSLISLMMFVILGRLQ